MAAAAANGTTATPSPPPSSTLKPPKRRNPPHLPTPIETAVLALYPALLVFGSVFALLSPEVRSSAYDAATQSHVQTGGAAAPSYFARKDNLFNVVFVKRGWAWITLSFAAFVLTHPHHNGNGNGNGNNNNTNRGGRARAALRWALVTGWWVLVTQWCFGPPLIDRGFRYTGGKCEAAERSVFGAESAAEGIARSSAAEIFSAAACRTAGGRWRGGHDISGHVFLLVLGSFFLVQEVGWATRLLWTGGPGAAAAAAAAERDPRSVVMHDGAVKAADVEGEAVLRGGGPEAGLSVLGLGGRFVAGVVVLSMWMLLMTAIYFHTWFEKFTGLLVALVGLYAVYILPRWVPPLRRIVGLPGI